jgi:hypothetical protein
MGSADGWLAAEIDSAQEIMNTARSLVSQSTASPPQI